MLVRNNFCSEKKCWSKKNVGPKKNFGPKKDSPTDLRFTGVRLLLAIRTFPSKVAWEINCERHKNKSIKIWWCQYLERLRAACLCKFIVKRYIEPSMLNNGVEDYEVCCSVIRKQTDSISCLHKTLQLFCLIKYCILKTSGVATSKRMKCTVSLPSTSSTSTTFLMMALAWHLCVSLWLHA